MNRDNKGMTLLETLIATVLLAFITLTANSFMIGFVKANKSIKKISEATQIGNTYLENIRMTAYESVVDGVDTVDSDYFCTWQVNEDATINMKRVNLQVFWPIQTRCHNIQLSTILAE